MRVERITSGDELVDRAPRWNTLAGDMPFHSWDWLGTWWKHYGPANRDEARQLKLNSNRQLCVLAVYDDGGGNGREIQKLVGLAPWYLDQNPIKGNVLRWLGSGEVCTDHLSLVCRPEDAERVAEAVADSLTLVYDNWDRIDLNAVDADDVCVGWLAKALQERACDVSRTATDSCWIVDLPASWDEYLSGVSKSHRKQLRQLERRVLETTRVEWHRVQSLAALEIAWGVLVDLHQRRRMSLGEPGCFASPRFFAFHREAVGKLLERGQLRMSWLALDGVPVAAEYHLASGSRTFAYQGGVDPGRLADEPGRLSTILCLKQAIDERHERFDFLRGDEPYKAHWRAAPHETFNYRIVPNRKVARLRGRVLSVADALTGWARQSSLAVSAIGGS